MHVGGDSQRREYHPDLSGRGQRRRMRCFPSSPGPLKAGRTSLKPRRSRGFRRGSYLEFYSVTFSRFAWLSPDRLSSVTTMKPKAGVFLNSALLMLTGTSTVKFGPTGTNRAVESDGVKALKEADATPLRSTSPPML